MYDAGIQGGDEHIIYAHYYYTPMKMVKQDEIQHDHPGQAWQGP